MVRLHVGGLEETAIPSAHADVYAAAGDWVAHVGRVPVASCDPYATMPFGAHAAAALAVGEIFRLLRARGEVSAGPDRMTLSVWSCSLLDPATVDGPTGVAIEPILDKGVPQFTLVGVGAVGSAFLLTLWASGLAVFAGKLVDGDAVSRTNLNRYPLFGLKDVGTPKASGAAALLHRSGRTGRTAFMLSGEDVWWADHARASGARISLLVSAVDTNAARHQLQDGLPRIVLGASTRELRAEVDRYDLAASNSRCLKCHNPVEVGETDAVLRARLLTMNNDELISDAEERGVDPEALQRYVNELRSGGTGCAILAGPSLEKLRRTPGEGAFAVSFVSALAGTMLAAQLAREGTEDGPALRDEASRAHFQLWRPAASVNGIRHTEPEATCWCSEPSARAAHSDYWRTAGG
jgi:molybdopterin/thiamine biosynthesis adenylyltransferase